MSSEPRSSEPQRLRRVVVAFDGSPSSNTALVEAAGRARSAHVPLLIACAVEVADLMAIRTFTQSAGDSLLQAAERCRELGVEEVGTEVTYGAAAVAVLDLTRPGDLVVVGTHGHRPVARMLLGTTSSSLVTMSRFPVLVVRPGASRPDAPVVVGVDGSTSSVAAVVAAAAEADRCGVPLLALTAVPRAVDALGVPVGPTLAELDQAEASVAEAVAGLHERYPDLVVERVVSQTHPVEALVRASEDARLVVVGSRGRGTFRALLDGSVSRGITQHAACSVLVVRPDPADGATPGRAPAASTAG